MVGGAATAPSPLPTPPQWGCLGQVPSGAGSPPRAGSPLTWQAEQGGTRGEYNSVIPQRHSLPPQLIKLLSACDMPSIQPYSPYSGIRGRGQAVSQGSVWKASVCHCWDALFKSTGRQHH